MHIRKLASGLLAVGSLTLFISACGASDDGTDEEPQTGTGLEPLVIPGCGEVSLDTQVTSTLQIDQVGSGPGDANLFFSATDPNKPAGATIDWNDLSDTPAELQNHLVRDDCNPTLAKDLSSFPQSNSCVGSSTVLDKQNLLYAAIANNNQYVDLAVQRASNNGDSAYYWLFTRDEPEFATSTDTSCKSGKNLVYDISATSGGSGDVLVVGNFSPSGGPELKVFQANGNFENVLAENVLDTTFKVNGTAIWKTATATVYAAVNTTAVQPGGFGSQGVISLEKGTGKLLPGIFAEAAVPLSVFTGGSSCGATYFASVLTQPSSSSTSDMKDFIGPFEVNFGSPTATASLTGSCNGTVGYTLVSATGSTGQALTTMDCEWTFKDAGGTTVGTVTKTNQNLAGCSGTFTLPAGTAPEQITATVKVTETGTATCNTTATTNTVDVLAPISVTITPDASSLTCQGIDSSGDDITYSTTVSGGKAPYTYSWTGCSGSTSSCTYNPADSDFCVDTDIFVTVDDSSSLCPPVDSNKQTYHKETTVTSTPKQ